MERREFMKLLDALIILGVVLAVGYVMLEVDLIRQEGGPVSALEMDEAFLLGTVLIGGLALFAFRRQGEYRKELEARIAAEQREKRALELALLDPLTGIANRRHFDDTLNTAIAAKRSSLKNLLMLIDLDNFKVINDSLGHPAGDEVLRITALRLKAAIKPHDLVSRIGGDEFAIVCFGVGDDAAARPVVDRLQEIIAQPISLDGQDWKTGGSIGFVLFPQEGYDAAEIMHQADQALYHAKQERGAGR